jgi:hypothetical protein
VQFVSLLVLLFVTTGLVGCSHASATGTRTTTVDGREVFVADVPGCDDTGDCAEAYMINGRMYVGRGACLADPPKDQGELVAVIHGTRLRAFYGTQSPQQLVAELRRSIGTCRWQLFVTG